MRYKNKAEIFCQVLMFLENRGDFKLSAGVLLPDHFHLLLKPKSKNVSEIMHDLKSYVANQINHSRRGRDASPFIDLANILDHNTKKLNIPQRQGLRALPFVKIWQRSFYYHIILSEEDFENHFNYIHFNPVKHGYVSNTESWLYLWLGHTGSPGN